MIATALQAKKCVFLSYNSTEIARFRRRALATKNEILAYLIGEMWMDDGARLGRIDRLYFPKLATSTPDEVQSAEDAPHGYIGSLHSHPNVTYIGQSMEDSHSAILEGEQIYGIYSYFTVKDKRRLARLQWYSPGRIVIMNNRR